METVRGADKSDMNVGDKSRSGLVENSSNNMMFSVSKELQVIIVFTNICHFILIQKPVFHKINPECFVTRSL